MNDYKKQSLFLINSPLSLFPPKSQLYFIPIIKPLCKSIKIFNTINIALCLTLCRNFPPYFSSGKLFYFIIYLLNHVNSLNIVNVNKLCPRIFL